MRKTRAQRREARDNIGEGGGEIKKRTNPHNSCRCDVGNGADLGGNRKERRQERVGSVSTDPDYLENSKEAEREAQGTQAQGKIVHNVERVRPLCRV